MGDLFFLQITPANSDTQIGTLNIQFLIPTPWDSLADPI